jgi:Peptidase family M3
MKPLPYPLSAWAIIDESYSVLFSNENWKNNNGLDFDEGFMKKVSEQKARHAELFLSSSRRPRRLFVKCVTDVSESKKTPISLELDKARAEKVVSKTKRFHGRPVNWKSWRQFNATADAESRKRVYDDLVKKTPLIRPLIRAMFEKSWSVHNKYGTTPLRSYLESERIALPELKELVQKLGSAVKKPFREALEHFAMDVKKAPAEYYDDFYYFRGRIFRPLDKIFSKFDPAEMPIRQLKKLGFDTRKIHVDVQDRPKKTPSAVAFFVQIPNDARVLVKPISPYTDMEASYHEFGHAMHCITVDPSLPLWDRESLSHGVAEIFSTFLESLVEEPRYLRKKFGLSDSQIQQIVARRRFMELFFVAFYAANSLMKINFQEKKLTMEQASELYAKLYKEYVGFEIPGQYWQLHHVMPDYDLYSPSYLIAAVRKSELIKRLENRLGEEWWDSPKSGDYLRNIMKPGANIDLDAFSRLDTGPFLKPLIH